jgi:hypothetical protein
MSTENQCEDSGGDGLLLAVLVGAGAVIHNASKNEQHQQEQQVHQREVQTVAGKDAEIEHLRWELRQKDAKSANESAKDKAEIARLNGLVKQLTEKLKWQELHMGEALVLPDTDENNNN